MDVRDAQQTRMHLDGPPDADFEFRVSERIGGAFVGGITYRTEIAWTIYLPVVLWNHGP